MSLRHLLATHVPAQSADVGAYTPTFDRFWATAAALLALAGVVLGGLALVRFNRRIGNGGRKGANVAMAAGLIAAVLGGLNLAVADGGPGTGNGVVAGGAALVLGLIAAVLGGLVLIRSRRVS